MNQMQSIMCPELDKMLRRRLHRANLPVAAVTLGWTDEERSQFNTRQEVMMQAVYDFAIRQARRELKKLIERTEP